MKVGKLPPDILKRIVFNQLGVRRQDVLVHSALGEDSSVIDFGDFACVLSTDPITGTTRHLGMLAIHISCNDVASNGAEPVGVLLTLLGPPEACEEDFACAMAEASEAARQLGIEILGGHTEVTETVRQMVAISTAIGKAPRGGFVTSSGARPGDAIVLSKSAGIEGTAIIASEFEEPLRRRLGDEVIERALGFMSQISVVPESRIAVKSGATAMHDVTEGGVLGAIYEVAEASRVGVEVYVEKIPVAPETHKICKAFSIDPLKLVSSGCMVITAPDGEGVVENLRRAGITASVVGRVEELSKGRHVVLKEVSGNERRAPLCPPEADELYKAVLKSGDS